MLTVFVVGGLILCALEFILPGGMAFFLGLSALIVSALIYGGVIEGWLPSLTSWFIFSIVLLFSLRSVAYRLMGSHIEKTSTDEDIDAYNQTATVCEEIPTGGTGRIDFRGSSWPAKNFKEGPIGKGASVRIIMRENLVWVVEPIKD